MVAEERKSRSVLIAEDDPTSKRLLQATLEKWGYAVEAYCDGQQAWAALQRDEAPPLAILDWMMPGIDGLEICRRLRALPQHRLCHVILLTAKGQTEDLAEGLGSGADDYVTKPFDPRELKARLQVGVRLLHLQEALARRVSELEEALAQVNLLQGLLPICSYCKSVRDDNNYWQQIESYVAAHSEAQFSHSICPACYERVVKPELESFQQLLKEPLPTVRGEE
ncbi:MAG: response regulator [Acidobacteria bacterium]|nr:response regulator [Acidobacteriota bacterium]MCI0719017.1 response regulator [Acidobacteriota bacterium]